MNQLIKWIENNLKIFVSSLIGLCICLIFAVIYMSINLRPNAENIEIESIENIFEEGEDDGMNTELEGKNDGEFLKESTLEQEIVIDIKGQVKNPGVYKFQSDSRVIDAINKAGELLPEADSSKVNFSQILSDQMVIYIPKVGEEIPAEYSSIQPKIDSEDSKDDNLDKIDINIAEKELLKSLNGIGDVKADNIISYREENGNFKTIDEIKEVSGIGDIIFENLKDYIAVFP